jgi:hypothetical protein
LADPTPESDEVTEEELEAHRGEELPDRQAMSIISPSLERPVPLEGIPIDPNPDSA